MEVDYTRTNPPEKCFVTDLPVERDGERDMTICYKITFNNKYVSLRFSAYSDDWVSAEYAQSKPNLGNFDHIQNYLKNKKHILAGLILNNKIKNISNIILSKGEIERILNEYDYPKTINERQDNLFLKLFSWQKYEGERLHTSGMDTLYNFFYLKNPKEVFFYMSNLQKLGYIENCSAGVGIFHFCNISLHGFNYLNQLNEKGKNSNNCFVAMSFNDEHRNIFSQGILPAIRETGFNPIRVDLEHPETTINDHIISRLKDSRFCIADFTGQKDGVYFEAGFALGRGLKVIYTCDEKDFKNSHFDTNHFPHILYNTPEDLKTKLIDKINAYIKD